MTDAYSYTRKSIIKYLIYSSLSSRPLVSQEAPSLCWALSCALLVPCLRTMDTGWVRSILISSTDDIVVVVRE